MCVDGMIFGGLRMDGERGDWISYNWLMRSNCCAIYLKFCKVSIQEDARDKACKIMRVFITDDNDMSKLIHAVYNQDNSIRSIVIFYN